MEKETETIETSINEVAHALREAKKYCLEVEVVTWALKAMKNNPEMNISSAIIDGLNEWVK